MITFHRTLTVSKNTASLNEPVYMFRGDGDILIILDLIQTIRNMKFGKVSSTNVITDGLIYSTVCIYKPSGELAFVTKGEIVENQMQVTLLKDVMDEVIEIGEHKIQIHLFDEDENRLTLPEVGQIYIAEPLCKNSHIEPIDTTAIVGGSIVGACVVADDPAILADGYLTYEWQTGEYITSAKLNNMIMGIDEALSGIKIDFSDYALKSDIPTKTSELTNDSNFLTSVPSEYVTETELNEKGYLTEHQDLSEYAKNSDIPTKVSQLTNDKNYASESYVSNAIANVNQQLASLNLTVVKITVDDSGNTEEEPVNIPVTGLQLDLYTYDAKVGGFFYINPIVLPMNATNRAVTWESSNNAIATVSSQGFVECIAEGDAVITCTTVEGGFTATCTVNIEAAEGGGETPQPVLYTITNNLTNVTSSNSASNVTENAAYSATLTTNSGYVLETVAITMGGTNITSTAYSNGNISISKVTGNIIITANAVVEQTEPEVPEVGGKIQFSTLERTAGGFKADGAAHTLSGTYYVTIPYSEGMTIRTLWNTSWSKVTYPAILVQTNGTYSTPTYTETDEIIGIGGKLPHGIDATLTGYTEGSTVIVQMLINNATTNDMDEIDYLYYIPGGGN